MTGRELLKQLHEILDKERKLLLKFLLSSPDELLKLQEEKRKLLEKLAQLPKEEFENLQQEVKAVKQLNEEVKILLLNNMNFLEGVLEEFVPKQETYGKPPERSIFKGKA